MSLTDPSPPKQATWLGEAKVTFLLALPLIVGQLGQMLMGVADTVMIGHVGVVSLAASTFANTLLMVPFLFGIGLLTSISIRVSQGRGGKRHDEVKDALRHGTWIALGLGLLVVLLIAALFPLLDNFGQAPEVIDAVPRYLAITTLSMIPVMVSIAWKNFGDALNRPWVPFSILLGGVLLNVFLNWLLIYGNWGLPTLGLEGAGWATLISRCVVVLALYQWLTRTPTIKPWPPRHWWGMWNNTECKKLLALGIPIGLQLVAEVGAFAAGSLMIGSMGVIPLAAHQVALTCASTSFMIPLGVAMAITVRMGEAAGEATGTDPHLTKKRLRKILTGGWAYGLLFTGATMLVFITSGKWLAGNIVHDAEVISLATKLLVIAGIFQIVDGSQVVSSSALRGMGDVKVPAALGIFSYWVIAIPAGALLGFHYHQGAQGIWWGLAFGLATAAVSLGARAWWRAGKPPA